MVFSTRRFVLRLTLCYFVLVFFSPFSIAFTSLWEERANLSAIRTFVRFVLVWFCRFPRLKDRLCNICNVVEDEIHFFCDCYKYQDLRYKMFRISIVLNDQLFDSNKEHFIKLMTSTDDAGLKSTGLLVSKCNIS